MLPRKPALANTPAIKAKRASESLKSQKNEMGIAQAALVMAIEGVTRATASEVARRAEEFESHATASEVGLLLHRMGIGSTISHGQARLVLDANQLRSIRDHLSKKCEEAASKLEAALADFEVLSSRIKSLEDQLASFFSMRERERELTKAIEEERHIPSRLPSLEAQANRLKAERDRVSELEKECDDLSAKISELPSLRQRIDELEAKARAYHEEEANIREREERLSAFQQQLRLRISQLTYTDLLANIQDRRAELEDLVWQIGQKRSLVQRLFGPRGR